MEWTTEKKEVVRSMLLRFKKEQTHGITKLLLQKELHILLTKPERVVLKELEDIDPKQYDFKGPYYGKREPQLTKLKLVPTAMAEGKQYLHVSAQKDLVQMIHTMHKHLGRNVVAISAYRSPAYQALLFLEFLEQNNFNMQKICRRVALPGWSEHGAAKNQAVDFDVDVKAGKRRPPFGTTKEYRWLKLHAHQYNFYLSYPRDNPHGVQFEPWHWHWEKR